MSVSFRPPPTFNEIIWDVLANIVYLCGVVLIELVIRPLFGSDGPPFITQVILTIGDLTLILGLISRLVKAATRVVKEFGNWYEVTKQVVKKAERPTHGK